LRLTHSGGWVCSVTLRAGCCDLDRRGSPVCFRRLVHNLGFFPCLFGRNSAAARAASAAVVRQSRSDISPDDGLRIPMKALVLAAPNGIGAADAQIAYHTSAYNHYQNNWTANGWPRLPRRTVVEADSFLASTVPIALRKRSAKPMKS
jgi:hypothetical protein